MLGPGMSAASSCLKWQSPSDQPSEDQSKLDKAVNLLPEEVSRAYQSARQQVPRLVSIETPAAAFLVASNGDIHAAARSIAQHWKKRKELFGKRAFLPMTATGKGSLTNGDLEVFKSGVFVQLSNDSAGRLVFGFDRSRLSQDFDDIHGLADNLLRCVFYVMVSALPSDTTKSFILLVICSPAFEPSTEDPALLRGIHEISHSSMPFGYHATRMAFLIPRSDRKRFIEQVIPTARRSTNECAPKDKLKLEVMIGRTKNKLLQQLIDSGLEESGIPVVIGGKCFRLFEGDSPAD